MRPLLPPDQHPTPPFRNRHGAQPVTPPRQPFPTHQPHSDADFDDYDEPTNVRVVAALLPLVVLAATALLGLWLWAEHGSNWYAQRTQNELNAGLPVTINDVFTEEEIAEFNVSFDIDPQAWGTAVPDNYDPGAPGSPMATITAPTIGLDWTIVNGVSRDNLKAGAGWMPGTAFPGTEGNSVISGHRTTYGAPFRHLDSLTLGDQITVSVPGHRDAIYEVRDITIVEPGDVYVAAPTNGVRLTLTTCHPVGSDRERLIVQAELVDGAAIDAATPPETWNPSAA